MINISSMLFLPMQGSLFHRWRASSARWRLRMSAEATHYLIDDGVRGMGIDANGWDVPIWKMHQGRRYWEAHRVMLEKEYSHIENLVNLPLIPKPYAFKVPVFPIKFCGLSGSPIRAVAMVEEQALGPDGRRMRRS